jgi:hypothetical protein
MKNIAVCVRKWAREISVQWSESLSFISLFAALRSTALEKSKTIVKAKEFFQTPLWERDHALNHFAIAGIVQLFHVLN